MLCTLYINRHVHCVFYNIYMVQESTEVNTNKKFFKTSIYSMEIEIITRRCRCPRNKWNSLFPMYILNMNVTKRQAV